MKADHSSVPAESPGRDASGASRGGRRLDPFPGSGRVGGSAEEGLGSGHLYSTSPLRSFQTLVWKL